MPKRKKRLRVVFDTNVVIRHFISYRRKKQNFNRRVFELWLIRNQIQLVVSTEIVKEFLDTMKLILGIAEGLLEKWEGRFFAHHADVVSPGKRFAFSRDPKDNLFLAVAAAGKADFLITNDRDLLEIAEADKRNLKFRIVTPEQFIEYWENVS